MLPSAIAIAQKVTSKKDDEKKNNDVKVVVEVV